MMSEVYTYGELIGNPSQRRASETSSFVTRILSSDESHRKSYLTKGDLLPI